MDKRRSVSTLALAALLVTGCGVATPAPWPAGTQAFLKNPDGPRVLVRIPWDQRGRVQDRPSVRVLNGTRVIIVADPQAVRPVQGASPVRVQVAGGAYDGVEVLVPRLALSPGPPLPTEVKPMPGARVALALGCVTLLAVLLWVVCESVFEDLRWWLLTRRYRATRHPGGPSVSVEGHPHSVGTFTPLEEGEWIAWVADWNAGLKQRRRQVAPRA
jgi:hypothetical protein